MKKGERRLTGLPFRKKKNVVRQKRPEPSKTPRTFRDCFTLEKGEKKEGQIRRKGMKGEKKKRAVLSEKIFGEHEHEQKE